MPRMLHFMIALYIASQETSRMIQRSSVDIVTYLHPESLVSKIY